MFFRPPFLEELEFGNVVFWGEGKTGVAREKPLRTKERTNNKLNPQVALIEHGPHWWEATALTTAPSSTVPCIFYLSLTVCHFLTVDATIGNQAFNHDRCNIFPELSYNKENNTILNSLRKKDVAPATIKNKCKNQNQIHRRDILWHKDRMRLQQAVWELLEEYPWIQRLVWAEITAEQTLKIYNTNILSRRIMKDITEI